MFKFVLTALITVTGFYCQAFAGAAPGITAVYDAKKKAVIIKWQQKQTGIRSFVVQRSDDNYNWDDIALQQTVNFNPAKIYQFWDTKSAAGENYYRLKAVMQNGTVDYSASVMVMVGPATNSWVMYPVPVKDVLTLQYKGTEKIKGVVNVLIQNTIGTVLVRLRSASLNTVIRIPVNNLGKGLYDIRITIEDEVVWNQRFVK
jgi:Secretion system C-terminal sorting domain